MSKLPPGRLRLLRACPIAIAMTKDGDVDGYADIGVPRADVLIAYEIRKQITAQNGLWVLTPEGREALAMSELS